jgi:hypothetical protein
VGSVSGFFLQSAYLGVLAQIVDWFMPPLSLTFKTTRFISTFKTSTRFQSQSKHKKFGGWSSEGHLSQFARIEHVSEAQNHR